MKAIVENPLNVNHSPVAISLYVNMLNKIVQCNDEKEQSHFGLTHQI